MGQQRIFSPLFIGILVGIFLSFLAIIPSALSMSPQIGPDLVFFTPISPSVEQSPYLPPTFESSSLPDSFLIGKINSTDPDPTPLPTAIPSPIQLPLLLSSPKPIQPTNDQVMQLFEQYGKEFGVDPDKLARIAHCESTYNPGAVNGLYGGMYQFHPNTWMSNRKKRGWDPDPNLRFDARESIRTAAAKISAGGINAWPVCGYK